MSSYKKIFNNGLLKEFLFVGNNFIRNMYIFYIKGKALILVIELNFASMTFKFLKILISMRNHTLHFQSSVGNLHEALDLSTQTLLQLQVSPSIGTS